MLSPKSGELEDPSSDCKGGAPSVPVLYTDLAEVAEWLVVGLRLSDGLRTVAAVVQHAN